MKIRFRQNSNGTSSIRLNFFSGYEIVNGKRKAKRLIKTLPFHLITDPKTKDEKNQNELHIKKAKLLAKEWEKNLYKKTNDNGLIIDPKIPKGNLSEKWINHKSKINLVKTRREVMMERAPQGWSRELKNGVYVLTRTFQFDDFTQAMALVASQRPYYRHSDMKSTQSQVENQSTRD